MNPGNPETVGIIGDGCAGLLLADRLTADRNAATPAVNLFGDGAARPDHYWGYWDSGETFLAAPRRLAKKSWPHWDIVTSHGTVRMGGGQARYTAVSSQTYETCLNEKLATCDRLTRTRRHLAPDSAEAQRFGRLYDTASVRAQPGGLLQHFRGFHVTAARACFDPSAAILMDFRVSQAQGVHFIYLLPFSETEALVESTLFSEHQLDAQYYEAAIAGYLNTQFPDIRMDYSAPEAGCIPMAVLQKYGPGIGVGLAGHALRASSGYAFYQIHRQIDGMETTDDSPAAPATSTFEQWMDKVFLRVLARHPHRAPEIFLRMAQTLSGDAFAEFMNGHARRATLAKVIAAVPKWPFIRCAL